MARPEKSNSSRRKFMKKAAFAGTVFPFMAQSTPTAWLLDPSKTNNTMQDIPNKSIIGQYGEWAASQLKDPGLLSFRKDGQQNLAKWKAEAQDTIESLVATPEINKISDVVVHKAYTYDGLDFEEVSWQLSNGGGPTEAIIIKPKGIKRPLPAILALHDHGGNKYFGKRKITKTSDEQHPLMATHQKEYYEGRAWANEIAKRGYLVMVHDTFVFGSRRIKYEDVEGITWGHAFKEGRTDENPEDSENIAAYNQWASDHEHILSKSLFCAGTTWPGVVLAEDRVALDILSRRSDVDANHIGCAGLSGGGLRTVYLGGLDHRIKCAVAVGFMSTWRDFIMHKSFTHTWMLYAPLIPRYLEFPEILGLRAPLPTMVLNNQEDQLFSLSEMKRADNIMKELFFKAKASEKYAGNFYAGPHKFDAKMQSDAFDWFDKWLKK